MLIRVLLMSEMVPCLFGAARKRFERRLLRFKPTSLTTKLVFYANAFVMIFFVFILFRLIFSI